MWVLAAVGHFAAHLPFQKAADNAIELHPKAERIMIRLPIPGTTLGR